MLLTSLHFLLFPGRRCSSQVDTACCNSIPVALYHCLTLREETRDTDMTLEVGISSFNVARFLRNQEIHSFSAIVRGTWTCLRFNMNLTSALCNIMYFITDLKKSCLYLGIVTFVIGHIVNLTTKLLKMQVAISEKNLR